ncbi:MAG: DUF4296 domain-containing protein [Rikenellaceae bacterium]|nr:DUF4296 domain-containing protein [Rikenellaceae bacterium]
MRSIFCSFLTLTLLALVGCNKHKTIPDRELAAIFHDAVVVNAYLDNETIRNDSLNIYEPIFEKYGYTTDDVRYTISSFLRRKSANLSDVVDEMIRLVEQEYDALELAVTKLDTIDNVARREARRTILLDTALVVRTARDSVKMFYELPFEGAGHYTITAEYTLDTLDKSRGRRFSVRKMLGDSTTKQLYASMMHHYRPSKSTANIDISEKDAADIIALQINLNDFRHASARDKALYPRPKVTKMDIHSVKVEFTPTTEVCVKQLYDRELGIRILSDTMFFGYGLPDSEVDEADNDEADEEATDDEAGKEDADDEVSDDKVEKDKTEK